MAEIAAADRMAPLGFIDFEDEHLTADRTWFLELLDAIERHFRGRPIELRAMNGMFAPSLDAEMIGRMQRAGFKALNFALITTDPHQLRRFGRPDLSADLDRVLATAGNAALVSVAYLIVAGPGQDPRRSVSDLIFLAQRPVLAGVSVFYPAPGSADYAWCRRKGLLPEEPGCLRASTLPLNHTTDRCQAVTLLRLGRILNHMKSLLDQGRPLPAPAPAPDRMAPDGDRGEAGLRLLAAFLADGTIRGVDEQGIVYRHEVDEGLCRAFLEGVATIVLCGTAPGARQGPQR
jgi:hypothetical protein